MCLNTNTHLQVNSSPATLQQKPVPYKVNMVQVKAKPSS